MARGNPQRTSEWMIKDLVIQNFKSIKQQHLKCKRYNIFLGKPGVGKSNILEAIALLNGYNSINNEKFFKEFIRYEKISNLFYDGNRNLELFIKSNLGYVYSRYHLNLINVYDFLFGHNEAVLAKFKRIPKKDYSIHELNESFKELTRDDIGRQKGSLIVPFYLTVSDAGKANFLIQKENKFWGNIKKYEFKNEIELDDKFGGYLKPPFGNNVFILLESNPELFDDFASIFEQYNLKLLFDNETGKLEIFKTVGKKVYKIPFSLCPDTLKRYVFHLLAIKTNDHSVLLLEEPEAHCFPPYITRISDEIIRDKNNQYFIATHSPYLLTDFIERCPPKELGLYVTTYKDYQTRYRELTQKEIKNIISNGIDFFYNINAFSE